MIVDRFGQLGVDPGTAWTGSSVSTLDQTVPRKPAFTAGDPTHRPRSTRRCSGSVFRRTLQAGWAHTPSIEKSRRSIALYQDKSITFTEKLSCNYNSCMKQNSQLSDVLHVLLHMAENEGPTTSKSLATAMLTNPVVLRRVMGGLRDAGFVMSAKGHGGGWVLSCDLERITLGDVYQALGAPPLVSLGFRESRPSCLVAQAVNDALAGAAQEAEALLLGRLGTVTLAKLSADFHRRMAQHKASGHAVPHHLKEHMS